jgi:hypothetical protein
MKVKDVWVKIKRKDNGEEGYIELSEIAKNIFECIREIQNEKQ